MISPQAGQAVFRIAFLMVVLSIVMLFVLTPGTAEFVISVVTLVIGLIMIGVIFVLVRVVGR